MEITLTDLKQRLLERADPNDLVEHLALTSEDLINAFEDKIEERHIQLESEYYEESEDDEAV